MGQTLLVAPLERRVAGDESAGLEDADFIGENMHVEDAAARRIRHASVMAPSMSSPSCQLLQSMARRASALFIVP